MYVVLVEPEYEGNLGLIARVAKNFGAEGLILVNPRCEIGEEARRRAMHAVDYLEKARIFNSLEDVRKELDFLAATTAKTASAYNVNRAFITPDKLELVESMGVVFGRESSGLTNEEIALCDVVVHIPTSREYPTLNITHAVAIVLYELFKRRKRVKVASRRLRDQIYYFYGKILESLGYDPDKKRIQLTAFKRVIERSYINEREAFGLAGVLRKVLERINMQGD